MERDQILQNALQVFNENPECEKLVAFSDGNIFYEKDKNFILEHERNSKLKSFEINRSELIPVAENKSESTEVKQELTDDGVKNNSDLTDKGIKADDKNKSTANNSDEKEKK